MHLMQGCIKSLQSKGSCAAHLASVGPYLVRRACEALVCASQSHVSYRALSAAVIPTEAGKTKPETTPWCWDAPECATAYLLILKVLTVHKRHIEPDSVRRASLMPTCPPDPCARHLRITPHGLRVFAAVSHRAPVPGTSERSPPKRRWRWVHLQLQGESATSHVQVVARSSYSCSS